ncbi:hypothetical protein GDO86_002579, partial [Hymenochirus boettgeri]
FQTATDAIYLTRHVSLRAGVPIPVPALTVNRLLWVRFQSIISGCQEICLRESEIVMCGGAESMSNHRTLSATSAWYQAGPILRWKILYGRTNRTLTLRPPWRSQRESGEKYGITRKDCDKFAFESQQRWKAAQDAGHFAAEMAPIELKSKKGTVKMEKDEHPRPETTLEQMSKLPPVFKKDGMVTAGNASGICDGAGVVLLASEEATSKHNLTPLVRVVAYHVSGCDPNIMGFGPVPAITEVLKKSGLTLKDMDLVEVNEAFAAQYLAVEKALGLNREKTNVNGGAIALGHPLAASGSRIITHLTHELRRRVVIRSGIGLQGGGQAS